MSKKSLLDEAFLEAKLVKEAAMQNAKNAIAESLSPTLNSIFAQKIQEMEEDENLEEGYDEEEVDVESLINELESEEDETVTEDESTEDESTEDEEFNIEDMSTEELEEFIEVTVQDMISSGELTGNEAEEDLDLSDDEALADDVVDSEDEEIDIEDDSNEDEDINLQELMLEIEKEKRTNVPKKSDNLKIVYEHRIKFLKQKLNESQLHNSKLLYATKILATKNLTESQKRNVLAAFDKATTVNESKLIFESLNTSLDKAKQNVVTRKSASDVLSGRTQVTESVQKGDIISADPFVQRMQKLAGII